MSGSVRNIAGLRLAGWAAVALAILAALWAHQTHAAQVAIGHGLRLGPGYRPLVLTVTPLKPLAAERRLAFRIYQDRNHWQTGYDCRLVKYLEVPAGAQAAQTTVAVPTSAAKAEWRVEVSEEGVSLPKLTLNWREGSLFEPEEDVVAERLPHVLYSGRSTPETAPLEKLFEGHWDGSIAGGNVPAGETSFFAAVAPEELPENWLPYMSLDVVIVRFSELADLERRRPAAFDALRRWVFAGGNLVVLGVSLDDEGLAELDELLGFAPADPLCSAGWPDGWRPPSRGSDRPELVGEPVSPYEPVEVEAEVAEPGVVVPRKLEPQPPPKAAFRLRPLGLGMVVAVSPEEVHLVETRQWRWMFNELGPERWQWPKRVGVSTIRPNKHFWDFLIPGVGLAPVTEFYILITLFALGIGPVNYFLLRRWKKVHLLMFTVPGGAAAVTLLLMLYAVVSDGLGVRTRVRSFTRIDQRSGEATCWARLSYYAGLAPSGGLVFPRDVAVIPLEPRATINPYGPAPSPQPRREVVLAADGTQQLTAGWLSSRSPMQLVTIRSRRTQARLQIAPTPGKPGRWTMTNHLGTRIEQMLVCLEDGEYGWAEAVGPGQAVELQRIERSEGVKRLRDRCLGQRLGWPEGMTEVPSDTWSGGWWFWSQATDVDDRDSRREQALFMLTTFGSPDSLKLRPRTYLGVTAESPELELGTPRARQEDSLHVIVGNW